MGASVRVSESSVVASHRIVGSEVGRRVTPGNGSIRLMGRSRKRRPRGWTILFAPVILATGSKAFRLQVHAARGDDIGG